jgi:hypothetical protein
MNEVSLIKKTATRSCKDTGSYRRIKSLSKKVLYIQSLGTSNFSVKLYINERTCFYQKFTHLEINGWSILQLVRL